MLLIRYNLHIFFSRIFVRFTFVSVSLVVTTVSSSNFLNSTTHFRKNMATHVKPPVPSSTPGTGFPEM